MIPSEMDMALAFIESHPAAAAREIERQPLSVAITLFETLPLPAAEQFLMHLLPTFAARLCIQLPEKLTIELLSKKNANQVASILRCIPSSQRTRFIKNLPDGVSTLCRVLLSYSEDMVGSCMDADIVMLRYTLQAQEALDVLTLSESIVNSDTLPVIDNNRFLVGQLSVRELLRAKPETHLRHIMRKAPKALLSRSSLGSASQHGAWQNQSVLPVLNHTKHLVGQISYTALQGSLAQFSDEHGSQESNDLVLDVVRAYSNSISGLISLFADRAHKEPKSRG